MRIDDLPRLGLGLSSNLNASDEPHPYRLLDKSPGAFDFVEYSAPLSLEQASHHATLFPEMWERRAMTPVLFHPVHLNLYGPELEPADRLAQLDEHARAVGSPWVGNDVGWWHTRGEAFPGYLYVSPPMNERGLENAVAHAEHVQAHLGVPLVLENPAFISMRGGWHVLDFMAKLHARTGAPLLLDLGHLWSHQLARGFPLTAGLDGFPFEQVAEVHIAGGVVSRAAGSRRFYVDDHTQPVREELFELLGEILPRCTKLKALTFEGDGHPADIAAITLKRLRPMIARDAHAAAAAGATPQTAATASAGARSASGSIVESTSSGGRPASRYDAAATARAPSADDAPPPSAASRPASATAGNAPPRLATASAAPGAGSAQASVATQTAAHMPPAAGPLAAPDRDAVALFEESYGLAQPTEDPPGVAAELDFRLAVLAEKLDRAFPITRLLLAPTKDGLLGFTRSAPFRACYVDAERSLEKAFEAYALAQLRERRDPALEAVVAIEAFKSRGGAGSSLRARMLPVDLREAEFAARALKRHLCGRAWVSGELEHSALDAVLQAVRRAVARGTGAS